MNTVPSTHTHTHHIDTKLVYCTHTPKLNCRLGHNTHLSGLLFVYSDNRDVEFSDRRVMWHEMCKMCDESNADPQSYTVQISECSFTYVTLDKGRTECGETDE